VGHCISVDPYYLTYKAELLGYIPTSHTSRCEDINDNRGGFIARKGVKLLHPKRASNGRCQSNCIVLTLKKIAPDLRIQKLLILLA